MFQHTKEPYVLLLIVIFAIVMSLLVYARNLESSDSTIDEVSELIYADVPIDCDDGVSYYQDTSFVMYHPSTRQSMKCMIKHSSETLTEYVAARL